MDRLSAVLASVIVVIGVGAGAGLWYLTKPPHQCTGGGNVAGDAQIGGPFELTNQFNERVTDADVLVDPALVYFGFTFCPDVCPFDVARNVSAVDILDERGINVTPVFITVDPERDDVESLLFYAEAMHPKMVALTGTPEEIKSVADAYRAFYQKNGEGEDYLVDHSTFTYLMDSTGFLGFFRRDMSPTDMADAVACITGS